MDDFAASRRIATEFMGWHEEHQGYHTVWADKSGTAMFVSVYTFRPDMDPYSCMPVIREIQHRGWALKILVLPDAYEVLLYTNFWDQDDKDCVFSQGINLWGCICEVVLNQMDKENANLREELQED